MDWTPTYDDIYRGVTDVHVAIRSAWAERKLYIPETSIVDIGVRDGNSSVRWTWATRCDYDPTEEQIRLGTQDSDDLTAHAWREKLLNMNSKAMECGIEFTNHSI
jgi:hypothetical protein